ncbi:hypothetical protein NO1_2176 [Candidatus Termititenax aidoneus]|uniref:Uncharacterized protein n=1 Tax=Termititenax aidoneus TaxID=2218524 RepID=A0A388TED9_TERA1|nr:hypothetical protein NO1_2176 [Candidatus Termititenax aidoneus]
MTDISNHPYHFSVPATKNSLYAKYDISRPLYGSRNNNVQMVARTPAEQAKVADGRVDANDVGALLLEGKRNEVTGLIEQLKADGKLTEAEKVARIKEDFEKDRDLYLKNFTEWRNSREIIGKDFIDAQPKVFLEELRDIITRSNLDRTSIPESKLGYGQRLRKAFSLLAVMTTEELGFAEEYIKWIEEARSNSENKDQAK